MFRLPIIDIDSARLVPDWDAVMRGESGVGAPKAPTNHKPGQKPSNKKHKPSATHADASQRDVNPKSNAE